MKDNSKKKKHQIVRQMGSVDGNDIKLKKIQQDLKNSRMLRDVFDKEESVMFENETDFLINQELTQDHLKLT